MSVLRGEGMRSRVEGEGGEMTGKTYLPTVCAGVWQGELACEEGQRAT